MNNRPKFRIWDNQENKYFEPIYEAYKGNLYDLSITISGEVMRRTLEMPAEHESNFPDRYIIEQFTGLKDKHGKEIYEGDICLAFQTLWINPDPLTVKIIYNPIFARFEPVQFWKSENKWITLMEGFKCDYSFEIIGNIHQNPELLTNN